MGDGSWLRLCWVPCHPTELGHLGPQFAMKLAADRSKPDATSSRRWPNSYMYGDLPLLFRETQSINEKLTLSAAPILQLRPLRGRQVRLAKMAIAGEFTQ